MGLSRDAIERAVVAVIVEATGLPVAEVTEDLDLFALGLDSLDLSTAFVDLEDRLDVDIPVTLVETLFQADGVSLRQLIDGLGSATADGSTSDGLSAGW